MRRSMSSSVGFTFSASTGGRFFLIVTVIVMAQVMLNLGWIGNGIERCPGRRRRRRRAGWHLNQRIRGVVFIPGG